MAYTYTLPTVVTPAGTFTIKLTSEYDSLTVPTAQTILSLGELTEAIDDIPAIAEVEKLTIEIADDYTTYPEGFWWMMLEEYPYSYKTEIQILVNEGSGDILYFRGILSEDVQTEWTDYYYTSSTQTFRRKCRITWDSYLTKLKNVTIATLVSDIGAYATKYESDPDPVFGSPLHGWFILLRDIFAVMVKSAFGGTYSASNAVVVNDVCDFRFKESTNYREDWDYLYLWYGYADYSGAPDYYVGGFFNSSYTPSGKSTGFLYWGNHYRNCYDLLKALCVEFGLVPRYEEESGVSKIKLYARARTWGSNNITMPGGIIASMHNGDNSLILTSAMVQRYVDKDKNSWIINTPRVQSGNDVAPPEMPRGFAFELSIELNCDEETLKETRLYYRYNNGAPATAYTDVQYYDYGVPGWSSDVTRMTEAVAKYFMARFGRRKKTVERTYGSIKATYSSVDSTAYLIPTRRSLFSQGDSTRTWLAYRITKEADTNRATVTWIEE